MPYSNSLLTCTTSRLHDDDNGDADVYDDGYVSIGATGEKSRTAPQPQPQRSVNASLQHARRVLSAASITSKLSSARAAMPDFRASLPSMPPLPKIPTRSGCHRAMARSIDGTTTTTTMRMAMMAPAPPAPQRKSRLSQLMAVRTRFTKANGKANQPAPVNNQTEYSVEEHDEYGDASLGATLSWIEAVDEVEYLCDNQHSE